MHYCYVWPPSDSVSNEPVNLDGWIDPSHGLREPIGLTDAIRLRARQQRLRRWRQIQIPPEARNISMELNQLRVNSGDRTTLQTGEGSVPAEERMNEVPKTCENNYGTLENENSEKNDDVEKGSGNDDDDVEKGSGNDDVERTNSFLNRFLTSRGARREQNQVPSPDDVVDLTQSDMSSPETGETGRLQSVLLRRTQSHRTTLSSLSSVLSSTERLVEAYFRNHPGGRNQEPPQPVDDRDSFSSIAAVINSESQVDTAVEIDSMVSLSTSSSQTRNDASRGSDVDSGDSRAPRRR
uniref:Uncharacterized protein n=1 Tax=Fagus sylvatica TaxID=28930 RepID=A0A2N9HGS0_FAGSY